MRGPFWCILGLALFDAYTREWGANRVVRVLLVISWWNRADAVPSLLLARCRGVRRVEPVRDQLVCPALAEESRWWLTRVDEEGCSLVEYLLFLHPTDCLVIEESPISTVRGLDVDDIVSFVHRAPFVYHNCLEGVMGACFLSFGWLAFLKVQGHWICHVAGHFLSFQGYSVDLEDEGVFITISL